MIPNRITDKHLHHLNLLLGLMSKWGIGLYHGNEHQQRNAWCGAGKNGGEIPDHSHDTAERKTHS